MAEIVRETHPGISDADIPEAMSQIDQSDPRIGARIFGGVFYTGEESSSSNTHHCRGMGRAGEGILKSTPGFQKKGASTSSQVAHLHSRLEQTTTQLERLAEENERMRQHQREMEAWHQAVLEVQTQNQYMQNQWLTDFSTALAAGLPTPPVPIPRRLPERPTPPDQQQPQQQDGEAPPAAAAGRRHPPPAAARQPGPAAGPAAA